MPSFTVKNIPEELYERLRGVAERNRRSINSEIIMCLEQAVGDARVDPQAAVETARRLRAGFSGPPLSFEQVQEAKGSGRP